MPSLEQDLEFFSIGVKELKDYLLSEQLFWPLGAGPGLGAQLPRLTVGGLLLAQARLNAHRLDSSQAAAMTRLESRLESTRASWRVAWGRKAAWEFGARLNQWKGYLNEYRDDPARHADFYPQEVRWRTMLALLQPEAEELEEEQVELLAGLDQLLSAVLLTGPFVWDGDLRSGFPRDRFWFLYGRLKT